MRFLLPSMILGGVCAALGAVVACEPPIADYGPADGCNEDAGSCGFQGGGGVDPTTTSSSSGGAGGDGTGGSTGSNELTGALSLITSDCFTQPGTPYNGVANVSWQALGGAAGTASAYGGSNALTFDFTGVPGSGVWMYAQDTTMGGAGITSTLSYWSLPQVGQIQVPVMSASVLTAIADMQPSLAQTGGINVNASQIVLQLTNAGVPYQGLTVTGGSGGAAIAYDQGGCFFSTTATSTGTLGTILLLNSGLSGPATITVMDTTTMQTFSVPTVLTAPGTVTLASAAF